MCSSDLAMKMKCAIDWKLCTVKDLTYTKKSHPVIVIGYLTQHIARSTGRRSSLNCLSHQSARF